MISAFTREAQQDRTLHLCKRCEWGMYRN